MVARAKQVSGSTRRETASLAVRVLVARLSAAVTRSGMGHPLLRPTVFVSVRRGENLTFSDVVARKV